MVCLFLVALRETLDMALHLQETKFIFDGLSLPEHCFITKNRLSLSSPAPNQPLLRISYHCLYQP